LLKNCKEYVSIYLGGIQATTRIYSLTIRIDDMFHESDRRLVIGI